MINASNSYIEHCLEGLKNERNIRILRLQVDLDEELMALDSTHQEKNP